MAYMSTKRARHRYSRAPCPRCAESLARTALLQRGPLRPLACVRIETQGSPTTPALGSKPPNPVPPRAPCGFVYRLAKCAPKVAQAHRQTRPCRAGLRPPPPARAVQDHAAIHKARTLPLLDLAQFPPGQVRSALALASFKPAASIHGTHRLSSDRHRGPHRPG